MSKHDDKFIILTEEERYQISSLVNNQYENNHATLIHGNDPQDEWEMEEREKVIHDNLIFKDILRKMG